MSAVEEWGHAFTDENTRLHAGRRHCRACQRLHDAAHRSRRAKDSERKAA